MQLASLTHGQTRETRAEDQALIRKLTLCERIHGTVSRLNGADKRGIPLVSAPPTPQLSSARRPVEGRAGYAR